MSHPPRPTPDLIDTLVATATPVRRLRPPSARAALWLAVAAAVILLLLLWHGPRADLAAQLARPWFLAGLAGALLTGILSALVAFILGQPDRPRAWGLLPLPGALLWLAAVSAGCLTDWVRFTPAGFAWGDTVSCFGLLLAASVPLTGLLALMLRHVAHLPARGTILAGALAVAALSAAALSLLHTFEASAMILLWNFGAAGLVMALDSALGFRLARSGARTRQDA